LENQNETNFSLLAEQKTEIGLYLGCFWVSLPNKSHWDFWVCAWVSK